MKAGKNTVRLKITKRASVSRLQRMELWWKTVSDAVGGGSVCTGRS